MLWPYDNSVAAAPLPGKADVALSPVALGFASGIRERVLDSDTGFLETPPDLEVCNVHRFR